MSDTPTDEVDDLTQERVTGTSVERSAPKRKANAFSELMAKKPKLVQSPHKSSRDKVFYAGRDGLGAYIANPAAFGPERMIYYNDTVAVIFDLYPKASLHALVLPRDQDKTFLHPFEAFNDAAFLDLIRPEVEKTKDLLASELRRRYGSLSASEAARNQAMDADEPPEVLPEGRDWTQHIRCGVHAKPSMSNLHVHVFASDMVSESMKKRRHYESFNTPFMVSLEAFPISDDDPRRHPRQSGYLDQDMKCWRCGENFGNKFAKLKDHLEVEFEEWKKQ